MSTVEEIYEAMMDTYASHTGLRPVVSCDMSMRLYAVASQIFALNTQSEWVKRQCFPQTATGEYLDYHAQMRGLARKDGSTATGWLRFSTSGEASQDLTIPVGTVGLTAGLLRFQTVEERTLRQGESYVDVPAEAVESGTTGNIASGLVITMAVPPVGVSACTNVADFEYGTDGEEDEDLRERILDTYMRLPNGANTAFYLQSALSVERVTAAAVIPRARGISTVDVVISSAGGLPEDSLVAEVQEHLDSLREIAVDVLVLAPTLVEMDLDVVIAATEDSEIEDAKAEVVEAIEAWFDGSKLGESLIEAELGHLIYQCKSVKNYQIRSDLAEYIMNSTELPVLGVLTVGEMT